MSPLVRLPVEVLSMIPAFLRDIKDFKNASSTCRRLHHVFSTTEPKIILRLADASAPVFFSPHPYFLALATAPRLSHWASRSPDHEAELRLAFLGGVDGILNLSRTTLGLTMADIRRLHEARSRILNPLSVILDRITGCQWFESPSYWSGGIIEPCSLHTEAERAGYQMAIYAELFGPTMESVLWPEKGLPRLSRRTRLEFIKYCIPDWAFLEENSLELLIESPHADERGRTDYFCDHVALHHVLTCARWRQIWDGIAERIGLGFEEEWRQEIWWGAIQLMGMEQLALVKVVNPERDMSNSQRERLYDIRRRVEELDEEAGLGDEDMLPPDLLGELMECYPAELGW